MYVYTYTQWKTVFNLEFILDGLHKSIRRDQRRVDTEKSLLFHGSL